MTNPGDLRLKQRLSEIWQRSQPVVLNRLAALERAAAAAEANQLDVEQRVDATSMAHQLAGSLGMFGFSKGTRLAREIEAILDDGGDVSTRLQGLMLELRHELDVPEALP